MFKKYDFYLNNVTVFDNYWSDFGIFDAIAVIEKFLPEDWICLKNEISTKSAIWVISCTETLSEIRNTQAAFEILEEMLGHSNQEVVFASIDAINAMIFPGAEYPGNAARLIAILDIKANSAGRLELLVIDSLRKKIAG